MAFFFFLVLNKAQFGAKDWFGFDVIGRPELVENNGSSATGYSPMFRTGLGKPVAVKQSSIAKAQRVLRDDDLPRKGKS